jgi:hypothetical protein
VCITCVDKKISELTMTFRGVCNEPRTTMFVARDAGEEVQCSVTMV